MTLITEYAPLPPSDGVCELGPGSEPLGGLTCASQVRAFRSVQILTPRLASRAYTAHIPLCVNATGRTLATDHELEVFKRALDEAAVRVPRRVEPGGELTASRRRLRAARSLRWHGPRLPLPGRPPHPHASSDRPGERRDDLVEATGERA